LHRSFISTYKAFKKNDTKNRQKVKPNPSSADFIGRYQYGTGIRMTGGAI